MPDFVGVRRGLAVMRQNPSFGDGLVFGGGEDELAGRDFAHADVEQQPAIFASGGGIGEGIVADGGRAAACRRDERTCVAHGEGQITVVGGHHGIVSGRAVMVAVVDGGDADGLFFCFLQQPPHGPDGGWNAKAAIGADLKGSVCLTDGYGHGNRFDSACLDAVEISRKTDDAVGMDAAHIRYDQCFGQHVRVFSGNAAFCCDGRDAFFKFFNRNQCHGSAFCLGDCDHSSILYFKMVLWQCKRIEKRCHECRLKEVCHIEKQSSKKGNGHDTAFHHNGLRQQHRFSRTAGPTDWRGGFHASALVPSFHGRFCLHAV